MVWDQVHGSVSSDKLVIILSDERFSFDSDNSIIRFQ